MAALRIALVGLSTLVLGAHFLRADQTLLVLAVVFCPLILLSGRAWALRTVQLVLAAGALEWVRTTIQLVDLRRAAGQPFLRMAAILGTVAVLTALSSVLLESRARRLAAGLSGGR